MRGALIVFQTENPGSALFPGQYEWRLTSIGHVARLIDEAVVLPSVRTEAEKVNTEEDDHQRRKANQEREGLPLTPSDRTRAQSCSPRSCGKDPENHEDDVKTRTHFLFLLAAAFSPSCAFACFC
jgi:hypothetical protein